MPIKSSPAREDADGPRIPKAAALTLFTDRTDERKRLRDFFTDLISPVRAPARPVLSFYGVGGIGKTSLLRKAREELEAQPRSGPRLVCLDLDLDRWKQRHDIAGFFWHLRTGLAARGVGTPLFDYFFFALWRLQHPGEIFNLDDGVLKEILKTSSEGGAVFADLSQELKVGGLVGGGVQLFLKGAKALRDRLRHADLAELDLRPDGKSVKELETRLAEVLHHDLLGWLGGHPDDAVCFALDGFERVQSTAVDDDIQRHLADFCGYNSDPASPFSKRIGTVILGREELRWDELYAPEWAARVESHLVGGLAEADAREFLARAATHHRAGGDTLTADALREHAAAILTVTREQRPGEAGPASYHPYYLDLAYGILADRRARFLSADLGHTPAELEARFLRYLHDDHRGVFLAFQCFSLASVFDAALLEHLVAVRLVPAGLHFAGLVGDDYSFVEPVPGTPGSHRFHRLMELALLRNQTVREEDRAAARQRVQASLEHLATRAAFGKLAECTPAHLAAYRQAMTVTFERYADKLLSFEQLEGRFWQLEKPFDYHAFVNFRLNWSRKLLTLRKENLGPEHPNTLVSLNNLASLLDSTGVRTEAESLYRRALEAQERTLGPEHPNTLGSLNNLALLLRANGDLAGAEPLYRRALEATERTLGPAHPQTLTSLNNLAYLRHTRGDLDEAEPLFRRALEARERTLGPEHFQTLNTVNNLALLLGTKGNQAEAELLLRRVLTARERTLGPEHPQTLTSLNNLACQLDKRGDQTGAEPLFRRALEARERTLGSEHPDTLSSLNNLAVLLQAKNDFAGAESFFRRALKAQESTLGPEHPDTLATLNNLAYLLQAKGERAEAERLLRRAVEGAERILGAAHPTTVRFRSNLITLLRPSVR